MIIYKQLPGSDDKIHLYAIIPIQPPRRITAFLALKLGVIHYRFQVMADRVKRAFIIKKKVIVIAEEFSKDVINPSSFLCAYYVPHTVLQMKFALGRKNKNKGAVFMDLTF